ncbi:MAG: hypothetical protein AB8H79_02115, partial [Myxococcota bacterium]
DLVDAAARQGNLSEGLAATLCEAARWGHDPADWTGAVDAALQHASTEAYPWLVHADPRPPNADALKRCASSSDGSRYWLAPASVIRHLCHVSNAPLDAVTNLTRGLNDDTHRFATLRALGLPAPVAPPSADIDRAIIDGAARAGAPPPSPPAVRGSRKNRGRAWATELLSGRTDALSVALRACISSTTSGHWLKILLREASWVAHYSPSDDPVADVIDRGGWAHTATMVRARAAVCEADQDRVQASATGGNIGAAVLCRAQSTAPNADLWRTAVEHSGDGALAPMWLALACSMVPTAAEHIPDLIKAPETRQAGLELAPWCPTLGVLEALAELGVPADPHARRLWALGLAWMGDRLGADRIRALEAADSVNDYTDALALCNALGL